MIIPLTLAIHDSIAPREHICFSLSLVGGKKQKELTDEQKQEIKEAAFVEIQGPPCSHQPIP